MSDPVAEAAAQLVSQEQPREAGTAAAGESSATASAVTPTATDAQAASTEEGLAAAIQSQMTYLASRSDSSASSDPNVDASTSPAGAATSAATDGELPNVASVADDHTAAQDSAPNAAGANTTLPTAASSAEPPLHMRIAMHLEAIYTMAREHVEAAPKEAAEQAQTVKTHIGDVLHRISNGMAVAEGELVQKLEALYRVL